jgi:hypothetical protein
MAYFTSTSNHLHRKDGKGNGRRNEDGCYMESLTPRKNGDGRDASRRDGQDVAMDAMTDDEETGRKPNAVVG